MHLKEGPVADLRWDWGLLCYFQVLFDTADGQVIVMDCHGRMLAQCCFTSQMASSTCPGTTPASWWRTAARATRTPTTIPHHRVGLCAHPPAAALHLLTKTSQVPGPCHALQNQQGATVSSSGGAEGWSGRVALFPALPPALLQVVPRLCCSASLCTNEIASQSSISFQWGWVKNSRQGHVRFHW